MVICNRKPVNFLQRLPFITRLVGSTSTASVLERLGHATLWSLHEVTWPPLGEKKHHSYSACPGREGRDHGRRASLPCRGSYEILHPVLHTSLYFCFCSVATPTCIGSLARATWMGHTSSRLRLRSSVGDQYCGWFFSFSISHLPLHWLSPPVSGSSTHLVFLYAQIDSQTDRIGRLAEHHLLQPPASHCPVPTGEEFRRLAVDRVEMAVQLRSQEGTHTRTRSSVGWPSRQLARSIYNYKC